MWVSQPREVLWPGETRISCFFLVSVRAGRKMTGMGTWVTIVVFGVVIGEIWFVGICDSDGCGRAPGLLFMDICGVCSGLLEIF